MKEYASILKDIIGYLLRSRIWIVDISNKCHPNKISWYMLSYHFVSWYISKIDIRIAIWTQLSKFYPGKSFIIHVLYPGKLSAVIFNQNILVLSIISNWNPRCIFIFDILCVIPYWYPAISFFDWHDALSWDLSHTAEEYTAEQYPKQHHDRTQSIPSWALPESRQNITRPGRPAWGICKECKALHFKNQLASTFVCFVTFRQ